MKTTDGLVSGHIYVLPETYISFGENIYMSQEAAADWGQKKDGFNPCETIPFWIYNLIIFYCGL